MVKVYNLNNGAVTVSAHNQRISDALLGGKHFAYTIQFTKDGTKRSFTYHDSMYNFSRNIGATESMIDSAVECILNDALDYENYSDEYEFAEEFGYDMEWPEDKAKAKKAYNGCKKTFEKLSDILSMEEREELRLAVTRDGASE